jgi:hypothetical protein
MSRNKVFLALTVFLVAGLVSDASAASTWKRLGANPFSPKPLTSEADLKALVNKRGADLKAGFAKAGDAALYPAFMEQFPSAKIESVKVAAGEKFQWLVFKKKANGRVTALKDVTYVGDKPFDAFHLDRKSVV